MKKKRKQGHTTSIQTNRYSPHLQRSKETNLHNLFIKWI